MSSIIVQDLSHSRELDHRAMSAVHGGQGYDYGPYANVKVDVGIVQNIQQFQNIDVNTLNNVGSIGAGVRVPVSLAPKQIANASANPSIFF